MRARHARMLVFGMSACTCAWVYVYDLALDYAYEIAPRELMDGMGWDGDQCRPV
jgi:hypothetical protein